LLEPGLVKINSQEADCRMLIQHRGHQHNRKQSVDEEIVGRQLEKLKLATAATQSRESYRVDQIVVPTAIRRAHERADKPAMTMTD